MAHISPDEAIGVGLLIAFIVLFVLCIITITLIIWWRILSKTGFHGALGLLMIVPIANFILLLVLAFAEWPVQKENKQLRAQLNKPPGV